MLFRLYLDKYATKADVFAIERSTGIDLPLWMKQLPKTTGEIQDRWAEGRAVLTGQLSEFTSSAKDDFNSWLNDVREEAKEAAKKKANEWIDEKMGT